MGLRRFRVEIFETSAIPKCSLLGFLSLECFILGILETPMLKYKASSFRTVTKEFPGLGSFYISNPRNLNTKFQGVL